MDVRRSSAGRHPRGLVGHVEARASPSAFGYRSLGSGARADLFLYRGDIAAGDFDVRKVRTGAKGGVLHVADGYRPSESRSASLLRPPGLPMLDPLPHPRVEVGIFCRIGRSSIGLRTERIL